jgi:hypothetical protein
MSGKAPEIKASGAGESQNGETVTVYSVDASSLSNILAHSFRNAPLDTEFLVLCSKTKDWGQIVPVDFVCNMSGVEVLGILKARFCFSSPRVGVSCIRHCCRNGVLPEAKAAFMRAQETDLMLTLFLDITFDPDECAAMEKSDFAGAWSNGIFHPDNSGAELRVVTLYTQSLLSGFMLKEKLKQHENDLSEKMLNSNEFSRADIDPVIESLRLAQKRIPDDLHGFIRCMAYYQKPDSSALHTILYEEDEKRAEPARQESQATKIAGKWAWLGPPSLLAGRMNDRSHVMVSQILGLYENQMASGDLQNAPKSKKNWWNFLGR